MNREDLINFIPKPSNRDVIIYDTSLKDLIDIDVVEEYKTLLPVFNLCLQQYMGYKNNIEKYEKTLNSIYLFKHGWSEEDYLFHLQNEKKTYANLYGPIKKIESNITMLQKKIKMFDDKIQMQIARENKSIEERKKNIEKRINENVDKLISLKERMSTLKFEKEKITDLLKENQEEFSVLQKIVEQIETGTCKCDYCGSTLKNISPNSNFYKRTYKNIETNKAELAKILEKKAKNDEQISSFSATIKEVKTELNNDINFKEEQFTFYRKKSPEVLKLEGQRDEMLNNIHNLQKELQSHSETKSKQFIEMKNKIEKYELSLENLQKIKNMKESLSINQKEYLKLKDDLVQMKEKMNKYKTFLTIFFKIYEQKASEFCGKDFQFKIFDFENNYTLVEKFEIYYKTIKYENLSSTSRKQVDKILQEKFLFSD